MESALFVFLYESFQVDPGYTEVTNNRPATELRKFLPVQKAQTPLSCLAYRQIKPQRSEGRRPCLEALYISETP